VKRSPVGAERNPWKTVFLQTRPGRGGGGVPSPRPGRQDNGELSFHGFRCASPVATTRRPAGAPRPSQPGGHAADHGSRVTHEFAPASCNTLAASNLSSLPCPGRPEVIVISAVDANRDRGYAIPTVRRSACGRGAAVDGSPQIRQFVPGTARNPASANEIGPF